MARKLTVVTDETPPPSPSMPAAPKTIKDALEMGEREMLVALRAHAAAQLDSGRAPAHAIAGLMRQLRDLDREIRALDLRAAQEDEAREAEVEDGKFDASAV